MAYAIWAGVGIALVAVVAWVVFGERLDAPAFVGMSLIVAGVLILQFLSKVPSHGSIVSARDFSVRPSRVRVVT